MNSPLNATLGEIRRLQTKNLKALPFRIGEQS